MLQNVDNAVKWVKKEQNSSIFFFKKPEQFEESERMVEQSVEAPTYEGTNKWLNYKMNDYASTIDIWFNPVVVFSSHRVCIRFYP